MVYSDYQVGDFESRPSRARGSKLRRAQLPRRRAGSRAPHGRVDRNLATEIRMKLGDVAPLTGAWIETDRWLRKLAEDGVAPLTGAWIETGWH